MAFNLATFKTRALTAVVFVIVMLGGLLWNQWSFLALFTVIHFGCWWEYIKLVGLIDNKYQRISAFHKYGIMLLGFGLMLWFTNGAYSLFGVALNEVGKILLLAMIPVVIIGDFIFTRPLNPKLFAHSIFGLIYISLSWGLMMNLYLAGVSISCMNGGNIGGADLIYNHFVFPFVIIPLLIIVSIWINDTMAYIVGSFIGKTPLSKISPKKTWEGTIGGIILSVAVTGLIFLNLNPEIIIRRFHYDFSSKVWYIIPPIAAIFGTMGDLLESKLKRLAGVKDIGSLMPGHGGFLDRFDSLLLATPFVWLYVYFFIR
ncbi:MAG: phosphatidate cytidylyltransferase [Sphingobacteriales bacterium]|nr:phosphatidate cytidylyltransferase [Sphingobacteriales bacterium]